MQDTLAPPFSPQLPALLSWQKRLLDWLFHQALPLWWNKGTDHQQGGFHEKLTPGGDVVHEPRRTRVTARQIYVFSAAQRMGWNGPALQAVQHGMNFLLHRQQLPDGTFASAVTPQGDIVSPRFDLYEQAFALFALASAHALEPERPHLHHEALHLYTALASRWKHPIAGFEESDPPTLPLRSNPHMHLLEAVLAWEDVAPADARALWRARSDELANLCLDHLIDPQTGALREHFDAHWSPMPSAGGVVEPGHQFEWAWLLMRWGLSRQRQDALDVANRLLHIAETHGINAHGAVLNELRDDFSVRDAQAKLWPQTERIKAWAMVVANASTMACEHDTALAGLTRACSGLAPYLQGPTPGIWRETMDRDGTFLEQDCRASSLYHIVCAIEALHGLQASLLPNATTSRS